MTRINPKLAALLTTIAVAVPVSAAQAANHANNLKRAVGASTQAQHYSRYMVPAHHSRHMFRSWG